MYIKVKYFYYLFPHILIFSYYPCHCEAFLRKFYASSSISFWYLLSISNLLLFFISNTQMRKFSHCFSALFRHFEWIWRFYRSVGATHSQSRAVVVNKKKKKRANWTSSEGGMEGPNRSRKARTKYSGRAPLRQGPAITVWIVAKYCRHSNSLTALHGSTTPTASSFFETSACR